MKRGHAHMKLLLRKNEVCTFGASVEIRMRSEENASSVGRGLAPAVGKCKCAFAVKLEEKRGAPYPSSTTPPLTSYLLLFTSSFAHRAELCTEMQKPHADGFRKLFLKKVYQRLHDGDKPWYNGV